MFDISSVSGMKKIPKIPWTPHWKTFYLTQHVMHIKTETYTLYLENIKRLNKHTRGSILVAEIRVATLGCYFNAADSKVDRALDTLSRGRARLHLKLIDFCATLGKQTQLPPVVKLLQRFLFTVIQIQHAATNFKQTTYWKKQHIERIM